MDFIMNLLTQGGVAEIMTAIVGVVTAFGGLLVALYALFLLIPGEQPDKAIKWLLDFTTKYSKK